MCTLIRVLRRFLFIYFFFRSHLFCYLSVLVHQSKNACTHPVSSPGGMVIMLPVKCWENGRSNSNSLIHQRFCPTTCLLWQSPQKARECHWVGPAPCFMAPCDHAHFWVVVQSGIVWKIFCNLKVSNIVKYSNRLLQVYVLMFHSSAVLTAIIMCCCCKSPPLVQLWGSWFRECHICTV